MRTRSPTAWPATRVTATWRASSAGASRWAWSASTSRFRYPWRGTDSAAGRAACMATPTPTARKACASIHGRNPSCSAGRRARPRVRNSPCRRPSSAASGYLLELLLFGTAAECGNRGGAGAHGLGDCIDVAGADLALVLGGGVAGLLGRELRLLQRYVRGHLLRLVSARQLEHREVERVEAGERDELEAVAHGGQLALESGDLRIIELARPVEGRRADVRQPLPRELRVDGCGELPGLLQVGLRGLAPKEVHKRSIGASARDRLLESRLDGEESFRGAAPGGVDERPVTLVDIRGQEGGGLRIGAGGQHRRHVAHVRRQARGNKLVDRILGGHEN